MRPTSRDFAFTACLPLLLAACGGADNVVNWPVSAEMVQSLSGAKPPDFADEDVVPALQEIALSSDSFLLSDLLVFDDQGEILRGQTTCDGSACTTTSIDGDATTVGVSDLGSGDALDADVQAVATHGDVSLAQVRATTRIGDIPILFLGYGGWLDHSFFSVQVGVITGGDLEDLGAGTGHSVGDATGTNPTTGSGTWTGVMVGGNVNTGHGFQGDAELRIEDFSDPEVDVAFTNIYNLHTGSPRADMTWSDVPVTSGGFGTGSDGDSIEGKFYGPNHEEVGGIFERDEIFGAFGAVR